MQKTSRIGVGHIRCRLSPEKAGEFSAGGWEPAALSAEECMVLAIADALLGAAGLGGVASNYNLQDNPWDILRESEKKVYFTGYQVANIDIAFWPVSAFNKPIQEIHSDLSRHLYVESEQINIKPALLIGEKADWLECHTVCLLGGR